MNAQAMKGWGAALLVVAAVSAPWCALTAQSARLVTPRSGRTSDEVIAADLARFDSLAAQRVGRAGIYVQLAREAYEKNEAGPLSEQLLAASGGAAVVRSGRAPLWALLDSVYARPTVTDDQRQEALGFEAALLRAQHPILGAPSCAEWEQRAEAMAVALRVVPPAPQPPPRAVEKALPPPVMSPLPPAELRGVPSRVHFALDRSELSPRSRQVLDALVDSLGVFPMVNVALEGHTDRRASVAYNDALSRRRAVAVQQYLIRRGVSASRITIAARGKAQLEREATGVVDHARNRRVMFRFLGADGKEIPATEQLDDLQLERKR
jgi:outer membrane protein OmpA-like peptidoglycan-associated protein